MKCSILALTLIAISVAGVPLIAAEVKPNVLFIYLDDFGWKDTGYMGSDFYETPNLDRLAAEGMVFTDAYSCAANCAPARACLLSGQYTPRHRLFNVGTRARGNAKHRRLKHVPGVNVLDPKITTWAKCVQDVGYKTGDARQVAPEQRSAAVRFRRQHWRHAFRQSSARLLPASQCYRVERCTGRRILDGPAERRGRRIHRRQSRESLVVVLDSFRSSHAAECKERARRKVRGEAIWQTPPPRRNGNNDRVGRPRASDESSKLSRG